MSFDPAQGFRLGPFKIEPPTGAIVGADGESHHLEPKVMAVFVCLARHVNELVTRDQLFDAIWRGQDVSDEPITRAISELRRALKDSRAKPTFIETIPKRGYRLLGNLRRIDDHEATTAVAPPPWPGAPSTLSRMAVHFRSGRRCDACLAGEFTPEIGAVRRR